MANNNLTSSNMNYIFNVEYFFELRTKRLDKLADVKFQECNEKIENFKFNKCNPEKTFETLEGYQSFSLYTLYPGLLVGTGNLHDIANKESIKLGFTFDYVTGLPYIPGSSVKGMLRSCFKHPELIESIINKTGVNVEELKKNMFEHGDIFLDAFPVDGGKILESDHLAPHGKDETISPIPLRMIKVGPGVKFVFSFVFSDYIENKNVILTAAEKLNLCKELIKLLGVGAKTNTGYGRFTDKAPVVKPVNQTAQTCNTKQTQKTSPKHVCANCGADVSINPKTNKYNKYCQKCYREMNNGK